MLTVPVRIAVVAGPVFLSHLPFWVRLLLAIAVLMLQLEHFHFDTREALLKPYVLQLSVFRV